ncbi:unnamed protein product [marine sediment metagenome]|uniref:Uncharacterized protein n=1 Tax=marine sediment metagenome TaxID=412755 RepID=X1NC13_9ZZZZ
MGFPEEALAGSLLTVALNIGYEIGYKFWGFPDIGTWGKGSGGFRLPNLDDVLIDLGLPLFLYGLTGLSAFTVGSLAFGLSMFLFNTFRMTMAEIEAGPGVLSSKTNTAGLTYRPRLTMRQ